MWEYVLTQRSKTDIDKKCGYLYPSPIHHHLSQLILSIINVTKSKLVLLTTQQANKLRDELLGQGIVILFWKPEDWEDGGLLSQRTILPELKFRLFYTKRGGGVVGCCKLLGVRILCSYICPHRSGHNVPVNLQQDKCYSLFCNFLSLY